MWVHSAQTEDEMEIRFYNAAGELVGTLPISKLRSFRAAAAADQRAMDAFKRSNPQTVRATLGSAKFTFDAQGKSQWILEN
jgi:hypothetical protein